jgi:protein-disulfide isomerase
MNTPHPTHTTHTTSGNTFQSYVMPAAIVIAGALIAASILFVGGKPSTKVAVDTNNNANPSVNAPAAGTQKIPDVRSDDHILGNKNAPVKLVVYTDTECPFCKMFHSTVKEVINSYNGKVAAVYRPFPLPFHKKSDKESQSAECVASLNGEAAYWNFIDLVFNTTSGNDSLDPAKLPEFAAQVGVDVNQFNSCVSSGKFAQKIQDSIAEGTKGGVQGTPHSVLIAGNEQFPVNGGALPAADLKLIIDAVVKNL